MGLGLLILVSVGKENIYLSVQPEITFFKIAYKRHTNFSIEPTPQYFKTTPDFGRRCSATISKNADLLHKAYVYVELPNIQMENFNTDKSFAWNEKIGLALINFVEIEIGGNIIDRQYGDWLNIWNELTISPSKKNGYNNTIGNYANLISFTTTKLTSILYIPLAFWFCLDIGIALPLIALIHNDIKIHVEFNDINLCYKISPSHYMTVSNNYCLYKPDEFFFQVNKNNRIIGRFVSFDTITQTLYYNPIKGKFIIPATTSDSQTMNFKILGQDGFEMNIKPLSVIVEDNTYFKFNTPSLITSYLVVDYIYLDNFERQQFLAKSHEYLIPTIQTIPEQIAYSTNINYKLPLINPVKLICWRIILLSNINSNNQFYYMSYPYTDEEEYLINSNLLVLNSVNRCELDSIEYYTSIQKYQYEIVNEQKGIYMYSFALNPLDLQPSGTMNFNKIDDAFIQLKLNKVINYQNPASIKAYAIQYNLLRTSNGISSFGFE